MNIMQATQYINAQAITPDQLLPYVAAVSNMQSELIDDYVVHSKDGNVVLVGYALHDAHNTAALNDVIEKICAKLNVLNLTVLAPVRPSIAPNNAISSAHDAYWILPIPAPKPQVKVRNMLTRATSEVDIIKSHGQGAWSSAHQEMMLNYICNKNMDAALCTILQRLSTYIMISPQVELFSAYSKDTHELLACAVADFSSFSTAFYMFAFRQVYASPGVADALLYALFNAANAHGHSQCNLGLGINDGIKFFKQKWGAKATIPFVQTKWQIESPKKTWFSRFTSS